VLLANDTDGNAAADPDRGVIGDYRRAGFEMVDPGRFLASGEDYTAQIGTLKRAGVDIVTGIMAPPHFATFWTQAGQQGFHPKVVTVGKALLFPSAVAAIGPRADGLSCEIWWSPHHPFRSSLTGQTAAELATAYTTTTRRPWTQPIGFKHPLFEVAIDVLRRAADPTDPGAILQAIRETDYHSVVGPVHWAGSAIKNVSRTPLVAGQWRLTPQGFDLVICTNASAADIPVTDKLRLLG
jgi:branched-chain amino acid transport system substrate-binding protein